MSTKGIVGITLCILGVVVSATVLGLYVAPLLLVPGIVLSHLGLRAYTAEHRRTSAALVVTLTLSYIASGIAVLFIAGTVTGLLLEERRKQEAHASSSGGSVARYTPTPSYDYGAQPASRPNQDDRSPYILAAVYQANTTPLSKGDTEILLRFGTNGTAWNRASAPLIRDYLDPNISGNQWVERSRTALAELRTVFLRTKTDYQLLTDSGAKGTVRPIVEIQESMLALYQQLQTAIATGDADREKATMSELQAAGLRKQQVALPIVQRLRDQIGTDADKRMQEMITEIGELTAPK